MKSLKVEKIIIVLFSCLCLALGLYYAWFNLGSAFPWRTPADVRFLIPSAVGIRPGQTVTDASAPNRESIGTVRSLRAVSAGVMITISLESGAVLKEDARLVVRPLGASKTASIELSPGSSDAAVLTLPAIVPAEIQLGPPDDLLEPAPQWAT